MPHYANQHMTNPGEVGRRLTTGFKLLGMAETAPRMVSGSDAFAIMVLNNAVDYFVEGTVPIIDQDFPDHPHLTSDPDFWYSKTARVARVHHASYRSVAAQVRKYANMPLAKLEAEAGLSEA